MTKPTEQEIRELTDAQARFEAALATTGWRPSLSKDSWGDCLPAYESPHTDHAFQGFLLGEQSTKKAP